MTISKKDSNTISASMLLERSKTTNLEVIRSYPKKFLWGQLVKIHDIGDYSFIEYTHSHKVYQDNELSYKTSFHVYVKGEDSSWSLDTLDQAMVMAIAVSQFPYKDECNAQQMAFIAATALNLKPNWNMTL